MILISHRGNTSGPIPELENHPTYIDKALSLKFQVELDVWRVNSILYLGHDEPVYKITHEWLNDRINKLWIHCKNIEAVEWFYSLKGFNYFWHEEDTVTLTSKNYIWAYPGKQPIKNSIAVMPEINKDNLTECIGVCSDYVENYNF